MQNLHLFQAYVFDELNCEGNEESVFDCLLGPWLLQ